MNIAVIGAGKRGRGIAHLAAISGHTVALYDTQLDKLDAAKARIFQQVDQLLSQKKINQHDAERVKTSFATSTQLEQFAGADLMIEAVPEDFDMKNKVFGQIDRIAPRTTILCTMTRSMSVTVIASAAQRFPERVVGMNFFLPVESHPLVQIISADQTSADMLQRTVSFVRQMGKTVVMVKDTPGAIVDRLGTVYMGEALRLLADGHTSAETVDKLMQALDIKEGPFRYMDTLGIDLSLKAAQNLYEAYFHEPRYRPHPIQQKMVQSHRLGRKTKQGFYRYDE